jgi:hypothetical protein
MRRIARSSIALFVLSFILLSNTRHAAAAPSAACAAAPAAKDAEAAFKTLPATTGPVPLLSRHRFLPVGTEAEICAVQQRATGVRYRVFLSDDKDPAHMRMAEAGSVWSEAIAEGSKEVNSCSLGDTGPKTLVHFVPAPSGAGANWGRTRVHVLACGPDGEPEQVGQFQTYLTNKNTCRALAILMCVVFYLIAAFTSYRIHATGREYPGKGENIQRNLNGNNYASFLAHLDPVVLTANQNGRGSATKLQILFFSMLIFGVVSYIWMSTGTLSELSETILILMGISGIGATAAAATEVSRKRLDFENWAWLINRKWLPQGGAAEVNRAQWKDIFMTNNEFDVSRFQMITFSVLVGLSLLSAGGESADLSTFTIPGAFLGILGLSQAVYVAGKLVDGPSVEQLNSQIALLRAKESALQVALASNTANAGMSDARGLPLDRNDLSLRVGDAYDKYIEAWETTRTMFESTLSESVSAVAEGIRPPFPYLSVPADALAALEEKYAELLKQVAARTASLAGAAPAPGDAAIAKNIADAQAEWNTARTVAMNALTQFHAAQQASAVPSNLPASDKSVRQALDLLRQRLAQLERLLAPAT